MWLHALGNFRTSAQFFVLLPFIAWFFNFFSISTITTVGRCKNMLQFWAPPLSVCVSVCLRFRQEVADPSARANFSRGEGRGERVKCKEANRKKESFSRVFFLPSSLPSLFWEIYTELTLQLRYPSWFMLFLSVFFFWLMFAAQKAEQGISSYKIVLLIDCFLY